MDSASILQTDNRKKFENIVELGKESLIKLDNLFIEKIIKKYNGIYLGTIVVKEIPYYSKS